MIVYCKYDELVDPKDLIPNESNRNQHSERQIKQLSQIIEAHGWRDPVILIQGTKRIHSGHCRVQSALRKGWRAIPAVYQDFDSESMQYSSEIAMNAIAKQSKIDMSGIHQDLFSLEAFDLELLGFNDFKLEPDPIVKRCKHCGGEL